MALSPRDALLISFYDSILQREGLGTLGGFEYHNYDTDEGRRQIKGISLLNPERESIYINFKGKENTMAKKSTLVKKAKAKVKEIKPATPAKEKKPTWPQVFDQVMKEGGGSRKEIIGKMATMYGGKEKQAEAWTGEYLSLLTCMGYCDKKDGIYSLVLFPTEQLKAAK